MDFQQNPDEFVRYIGQISRDFSHARANFLDRLEHWKLLSEKNFGGLVTIEKLPDDRGFTGAVLSRPFTMLISPLAINGQGRGEVVVTAKDLNGKQFEIARFNVDREGDLADSFAIEGGDRDNMMSIKIFMGVLKKVVETPTHSGS
ncbi:hypothetical protein G7Z99_09700 [Pseudomonas entomophila]|uniref:hypothetical protein n=1 Tax=Pseudomonas entomophila TaxID=312306 RepID=UPI0015E31280|nr:hypothetical protein [Pseudomonas entomophila]MBA1189323.1 hypothetical protein [Pseudomonas entomophila]